MYHNVFSMSRSNDMEICAHSNIKCFSLSIMRLMSMRRLYCCHFGSSSKWEPKRQEDWTAQVMSRWVGVV